MFFLFGFVSMTGQLVLLREILVIFHGTEVSLGIFFGIWLMGIGVGAAVGARLGRNKQSAFDQIFAHCLAALGWSVILQVIIIRILPSILGVGPAEIAPLNGIIAAVPAGTCLSAVLTGFLFPIGCAAVKKTNGRSIALLYAFEGAGGLIGGLAFTFILVRFLSPLKIAALLAVFASAGAIICGMAGNARKSLVTGVPLLLTGLALISPVGDDLRQWTVQARWDSLHPGMKLLDSRPTPYQQVEIAQLGHQLSLFGNGKIVSSFPDPFTSDRLAAMIVAQKPDAARFLLVGGAAGSLLRSLLHYDIRRVDVVEPDPWALRIAEEHMPADELAALKDPRVRFIFGDGRLHVNRLEAGQYDVIVCMVPDPVSSFWNRYFTLEFFRGASRGLTRSGVFVTGVTSSENFWGTEVASYAGSVYHTLKKVFPYVKGSPGDQTLFFASHSDGVVSVDPEVLAARYSGLERQAFDPAGFQTLLPPDRSRFVEKELERSPDVINTDFEPLSTSLAMILWGRFSGVGWMEALNTIRNAGLKLYLIPMLFFLVAKVSFRIRWGPRAGAEAKFQVLLAMAAIGAGAMGTQIALIYSYQSLFGYVFERMGLIAAVFMAGLVLGGFVSSAFLERLRGEALAVLLVLVLFGLLCLSVPVGLNLVAGKDPHQIELAVLGLVFISGILTGLGFAAVAARHLAISGNTGETSGWTDAADHFGAAAGALMTGTLLVPLLGITRACQVLALMLAVPAVLILSERLFLKVDPFIDRFRSRRSGSFPYARLSWALVFCVAAAAAWNVFVGPPGRTPVVRFQEETLQKISGSQSFTFMEKPYPHYVGTTPGESGFTVTLSTVLPAGEVRGYGGPINLLLSISDKGVIKGINLVESRETPSYIKGLDKWLEGFRGRSVLKPFRGDLDALTGATITANAIFEIVNRTGLRIAEPLLGIHAAPEVAAGGDIRWDALKDLRLWAVVGILALFVCAFYSRSSRVRLVCLAAALLVLGVYLNAPFSCLDTASALRGEIPAAGTLWRNVLFLAVLVISVLWGQAFCGFLCPLGALQEFLCVRRVRRRPSPAIETGARYVKFVALAALLCLFLVTDDTIWFSFSPLQHFFGDHVRSFLLARLDSWVMVLCVTILAASVFYFRFWCRYLCPAGAFLALFNKVNILKKNAPLPIPARCDLGVTFPDHLDCIHCHRCLHRQLRPEKQGT